MPSVESARRLAQVLRVVFAVFLAKGHSPQVVFRVTTSAVVHNDSIGHIAVRYSEGGLSRRFKVRHRPLYLAAYGGGKAREREFIEVPIAGSITSLAPTACVVVAPDIGAREQEYRREEGHATPDFTTGHGCAIFCSRQSRHFKPRCHNPAAGHRTVQGEWVTITPGFVSSL